MRTLLIAFLAVACGGFCYAQTTQPSVKYVGVYIPPVEDLPKWRDLGDNLVMGSELKRVNGVPTVDQRAYRKAAVALGYDYIDWPMDDAEDAADPHLLGWIVWNSDEWNRRKPSLGPIQDEIARLHRVNAKYGTAKLIVANADGMGVTAALWEKPPYPGFSNGEQSILPYITGRFQDWYPVVNTAKNTPDEIARRPMYLPAQAVWRMRTWCDAWHSQPAQYGAIIEAAQGYKSPLGVTSAQMMEQADYLMGTRPFPFPDANAKPVNVQRQLVDYLVFWTCNGQSGPGWRWDATNADQRAGMAAIVAKYKAKSPAPPTPPDDIEKELLRQQIIDARRERDEATAKADKATASLVTEQAKSAAAAQDLSTIAERLKPAPATQPAPAPATQPTTKVYLWTGEGMCQYEGVGIPTIGTNAGFWENKDPARPAAAGIGIHMALAAGAGYIPIAIDEGWTPDQMVTAIDAANAMARSFGLDPTRLKWIAYGQPLTGPLKDRVWCYSPPPYAPDETWTVDQWNKWVDEGLPKLRADAAAAGKPLVPIISPHPVQGPADPVKFVPHGVEMLRAMLARMDREGLDCVVWMNPRDPGAAAYRDAVAAFVAGRK